MQETQKKIYTEAELPAAFTFPSEYFSVRDTLECGQVFRYYRLADNVYGVFSRDKYAQLTEKDDMVVVQTKETAYFSDYFCLDVDYAAKVREISQISPLMRQAANFGKGIRILKQDSVETLFSFIISANNNIKRIQQIVERLCVGAGTQTEYGYAFPTLEQLRQKPSEFFGNLGAGYRDTFLYQAAQNVNIQWLESLKNIETHVARKALLTLKGVGPKVADCVLLFGLSHGDVFPVDTWLKKVYHLYFESGLPDNAISDYFCQIFGQNAGLCQQYLFYFQRNYRQI